MTVQTIASPPSSLIGWQLTLVRWGLAVLALAAGPAVARASVVEECTGVTVSISPAPELARLKTRAGSLRAGTLLVVDGASRAGDNLCAASASDPDISGIIDHRRLAPVRTPAAPPAAVWVGTWRHDDNRLVITANGPTLRFLGNAYWPNRVDPNGHVGMLHASTPAGARTLTVTDEDDYVCQVTLTLLGPLLVVGDNFHCGGFNVSFRGFYRRR